MRVLLTKERKKYASATNDCEQRLKANADWCKAIKREEIKQLTGDIFRRTFFSTTLSGNEIMLVKASSYKLIHLNATRSHATASS
jgi:hypothetical protein